MALIGITTLPPNCLPSYMAKAVSSTDSISLANTAGTLEANVRIDGVSGGGNNLAAITPGEGLYVPAPDAALSVSAAAFVNPDAPTAAEVAAALALASPVNPAGMIVFYVGNGTLDDPGWVWYVDASGAVININSPAPEPIRTIDVPASAFADPNQPLGSEARDWAMANGYLDVYLRLAGFGTAETPDWVWFLDYYGTAIQIESPTAVVYSGVHPAAVPTFDIACLMFLVYDVSGGSITQPLPSAASVPSGCKIGFKSTGNGPTDSLVLQADGLETIDGQASYGIVSDMQTAWLVSDGSNWHIVYDYDPLRISGIICSFDGENSGPFLNLSGSSEFLSPGQSATNYAWTVRQSSATGTILQQFDGAPSAPVTPAGYLAGGTYATPELSVDDYCGDLWVGLQVTDNTGKKSPVCQQLFVDFGLSTFTFTVNGAGTVNMTVNRIGGATVMPVWRFSDGSPDQAAQTISHNFTAGGIHTVTATACAAEVYQVEAVSSRLIGTPDDIVDWSSLINLNGVTLHNNQLTGVLPVGLGSLSAILSIGFANNQLTGPLPPEYGALSTLTNLNVVVNQLSGPLPPEWAGMTSMNNMQFGYNAGLTGPFPPEWAAWGASLQSFYVEHCPLIGGSLPPEYAAWTGLIYFWAGNTGVSGPLPPEYAAWTNLSYFLVPSNNLTGSLPPEYSAWTNLARFAVNSNQLTGPLPPEYGAWTNLSFLHASDNQLTGPLPPEYGAWTNLQYFYVSQNLLAGSYPTEYGAWTDLRQFEAHENQISGAIPPSYASWSLVEQAFLAPNGNLSYASPGAATGWSSITFLYPLHGGLDSAEIEALLGDLVTAGVPNNGYVALNQVPSAPLTAAACLSATTLQGLGWTVIYDSGGAC